MKHSLYKAYAIAFTGMAAIPLFAPVAKAETSLQTETESPPAENITAPAGIDLQKIQNTAENSSLSGFITGAQEYAMPILVVAVVISALCALFGIIHKPLRVAAGSILVTSIVFACMVMYPEEIVGVFFSISDGLMKLVTGS